MMFLTKKVSSFALLICCMAVVTLSASYADASLPKKSKAEVAKNVPKVLSDNDVNIYRKMFALQRKLDRDGVVALIPKLDDKEILMGHLVAERILHPRTKTPYADMQDWLSKYNDHPQSRTIYRLANRRAADGATHDRPAIGRVSSIAKYSDPDEELNSMKSSGRSAKASRARTQKLRQLGSYRKQRYYNAAIAEYMKPATRKLLGEDTYNNVTLRLAQQLLNEGFFPRATKLAQHVFDTSERKQPDALWIIGFAAYQDGDLERAAATFRQMAYTVPQQSTQYARAAFWAAYSYDQLKRASMARVFYNMAAQQPLSYYGMLAHQRMNESLPFTWDKPNTDPNHMVELLKDQGVRRTIALVQIGEHDLAQDELKSSYSRIPYGMDESLLAFALELQLPAVSLTLARNLHERNQTYLVGLFPEPHWMPQEGYKVDKALLFSIIRQESAFSPDVKSYAGARGLMQIMPNTARHIRDMQRKQRFATNDLYKPSINMSLGQDYVEHLAEVFDGNLIKMIAAYNAGPGNVNKWKEKGLHQEEPLIFVERIPFEETRKYVMAVLSNLWIYRTHEYGVSPSLASMAKGVWPTGDKTYVMAGAAGEAH